MFTGPSEWYVWRLYSDSYRRLITYGGRGIITYTVNVGIFATEILVWRISDCAISIIGYGSIGGIVDNVGTCGHNDIARNGRIVSNDIVVTELPTVVVTWSSLATVSGNGLGEVAQLAPSLLPVGVPMAVKAPNAELFARFA